MLERSLQLAHSMTRAASNVANANGEANQIGIDIFLEKSVQRNICEG
jgi:hypothetical protein